MSLTSTNQGQLCLPATDRGVTAALPVTTSPFCITFVDHQSGFIAYANHQPVAWANVGFCHPSNKLATNSTYFVDLSFLNVQSARSRFMDSTCFELSVVNPKQSRHAVSNQLLAQAKMFVLSNVKVGGVA